MSSKRRTPQGEKMHRWSIKHRTATIGAVYTIKREKRLKAAAQRKKLAWINETVREFHEQEG
jgi:hypothetical protein